MITSTSITPECGQSSSDGEKLKAKELLPYKPLILSGIEKIDEGSKIIDLIIRKAEFSRPSQAERVIRRLEQAIQSIRYNAETARNLYDYIGKKDLGATRRFFNFTAEGECVEVSEDKYAGIIEEEGADNGNTSEQTIPD